MCYSALDRIGAVLLGVTHQIFRFKNDFVFNPIFWDLLGSKNKRRTV